jgi:hypothetical protein
MKMKKMVLMAMLMLLAAGTSYAALGDGEPTDGVLGSKHDMNTIAGLVDDNQGRVCAFCHTPHHKVDLLGQYNPLWSHTPFNGAMTPYESASFTADNQGAIDPLIGPSRLCMSCHDGVIAPDQHYGTTHAGTAPSGRFALNGFAAYANKEIAIGLGNDLGATHPIGFDVSQIGFDSAGVVLPGFEFQAAQLLIPGSKADIYDDTFTGRRWMSGGVADVATRPTIAEGLFDESGDGTGPFYFTCLTCHDVHNKRNAANDGSAEISYTGSATDTVNGNYFVFAPQQGSQLCLSCHNK